MSCGENAPETAACAAEHGKRRTSLRHRLKTVAKGLTPPVVWNTAQRIAGLLSAANPQPDEPAAPTIRPGQQDVSWYDETYASTEHYHRHYTTSHYYFLWSVIADRIIRQRVTSVLDIACGPGQFAALLRDKGLADFCGVDFSPQTISMARAACPEFTFVLADVFESDLIETYPYDTVVCMEFLEHVESDLEIVRRVRRATRCYATVPNFPYVSHVRHFSGTGEVESRYGDMFKDFRVDAFPANEKGTVFFLFEGIRL